MGTSKRLAEHYDRRAEEKQLERYAKTVSPLQSLSKQELALDKKPLTVYPQPRRVKAWVRFGPQHARVDALLVRSTDTAVGIEFVIAEKTYRCWVWGKRGRADRVILCHYWGMPDSEPLAEPRQIPGVAFVFEAVDPVFLGMDAESWIPTEEVNFARAILALVAVDMAKVVLVVTGDMVASTRERLPQQQRDAFSDERGAGVLGGKTMAVGDEVHVLMSCWLYFDTESAASHMPENEAAAFRAGTEARSALARRTIVHEAQHVLMMQNGEAAVQLAEARARQDFLFLAHDVIDEYRAELGVSASLRAAFEYEVAQETLPAFRDGLKREVQDYERRNNVEALMSGVLAQAQHAWKALANVAAARRVGAVTGPVDSDNSDWGELAGPYWDRFEELLMSAPVPSERFTPEAQRQLMEAVADLFDEWLRGLGFRWRDIDGGRNAEFRITSRHVLS